LSSSTIYLEVAEAFRSVDGASIPDPNGGAWTDSFENIQCYDQLKMNAVLNWIQGRTHLGTARARCPRSSA